MTRQLHKDRELRKLIKEKEQPKQLESDEELRETYDDVFVVIDGRKQKMNVFEAVSGMVQCEVGSSFPEEATKAQAIVSHSKVLHKNLKGEAANVAWKLPTEKVKNVVQKVMRYAVFFDGRVAETTCFACSAGRTNSSKDIWLFESPYLVSVPSPYDSLAPTFKQIKIFSRKLLIKRFLDGMGIDLEENGLPFKNWFKVINRTDGGYNNHMVIAGHTQCYVPFLKRTEKITGKLIRQMVLPEIGSSKFKVYYSKKKDSFKFVSFGYGHGVGFSQWGAKLYAEKEGWDYIRILNHYFPGTYVAKLH
jgi:SpoIID/LytB domain protein